MTTKSAKLCSIAAGAMLALAAPMPLTAWAGPPPSNNGSYTAADVPEVLSRVDSALANVKAMLAKFNSSACYSADQARLWGVQFEQSVDTLRDLIDEVNALSSVKTVSAATIKSLNASLGAGVLDVTMAKVRLHGCNELKSSGQSSGAQSTSAVGKTADTTPPPPSYASGVVGYTSEGGGQSASKPASSGMECSATNLAKLTPTQRQQCAAAALGAGQ